MDETPDWARPPEANQELIEFLEHAPVGLCWVDPEGRMLWTNRAALELLGGSQRECLGRPIAELFIEPQAAADVLGRVGRREAVKSYEASLRTQAGAVRRVLIGASGLFRDGRLIHSRWVIRDVTALLEREQAARYRALDAGRLKDEFLALLSHELRTPLGAILVWLGLLRQGGTDPAETTRALEIIERSARSLERIIEDLLHASRIAAGGLVLTPQIVDLRGVVQVAVDAASGDARLKGLRLTSPVGVLPVWVIGDPGRLQQAVSNLLSNAVKFTPAGGRVEVWLETLERQARLRVADTGEGMSPAFLPFAFERFRQQDSSSTRAHHGLGLGLYVVRDVIGQHGGMVSAESPGPGQGSTFTVLLPLASAPGETARPAGAHDASGSDDRVPAGLTVLIVDDEEDAREALRLILQQNGMLVTTAASARQAFELVERQQPDVLVSDIAMPGEDGLSLIRRVRQLPFDRGGQILAIALSAYAAAEDRRKALLAGFQRHIPKPVDPAHLLAAIAAMVRNDEPRDMEPSAPRGCH
jgi:PAS domain S-box-containing protein